MIFAKVRVTNSTSEHRVLFSDSDESDDFNFYLVPAISSSTAYNFEKKLESDEWFYVTLNAEQIESMIQPYIHNEANSADLNNAIESDYSIIEVVYRVFESDVIFTKITNGYKVQSRKVIGLFDTGESQLITESNAIVFSGAKDAYFNSSESRLYFKKFSKINSMFPGIEVFFKEATSQEKQSFLDNGLLDVDNIVPDDIGQYDSSRIAAILADESIGFASGAKSTEILNAAQNFSELEIEVSGESKIVVKDKKDLKKVINLITSRYYVSDITGEKMQSYGSAAIEPVANG